MEKEEKMGKDEKMGKEEKKEKVDSVIVAGYKVHLHCPKCADDIRKPLLKTRGVQSVDIKFESGEIFVKGTIDEKKIHLDNGEIIEMHIMEPLKHGRHKKLIKCMDSLKCSPILFVLFVGLKETVKTTIIKAYMHCDQCERDVRNRLIRHKGIHNVKTDRKAQTITVEGTIESEKLLAYMRKRVHKHAEIIPPKKEKEEEKKEKEKEKEKKEKVEVEVKPEITKIEEFKEEKKVEAKTKEGNVPYFVHYVYAPQLFSDENPNACAVM